MLPVGLLSGCVFVVSPCGSLVLLDCGGADCGGCRLLVQLHPWSEDELSKACFIVYGDTALARHHCGCRHRPF